MSVGKSPWGDIDDEFTARIIPHGHNHRDTEKTDRAVPKDLRSVNPITEGQALGRNHTPIKERYLLSRLETWNDFLNEKLRRMQTRSLQLRTSQMSETRRTQQRRSNKMQMKAPSRAGGRRHPQRLLWESRECLWLHPERHTTSQFERRTTLHPAASESKRVQRSAGFLENRIGRTGRTWHCAETSSTDYRTFPRGRQ